MAPVAEEVELTPGPRTFSFQGTPPAGRIDPMRGVSPIEGRPDGRNVDVELRASPQFVRVMVNGTEVCRTSRVRLRAWLNREGSKPPYVDGELRLRRDGLGHWFEINGKTAAIILADFAYTRITFITRD